MEFRIQQINLLRVSGINSILGIDLYKNRVRVVEVKTHGGILNKFTAKYAVSRHITVDFPQNMSAADRGTLLAEALKKNGIKIPFCVSTIRSSNSRVVTADMPIEAADTISKEEIENWIRENYQKLIRVPIPIKDLTFDFQIISQTLDSIRIEVAFVRASERDEILELLHTAGLQVLLLTIGTRSAEIGFLSTKVLTEDENLSFVFAGEDGITCTDYLRRSPIGEQVNINRRNTRTSSLDEVITSLTKDAGEVDSIWVSGPAATERVPPPASVWEPLGLPSEYALAVGLAVQGFLYASPIAGPKQLIDFLPEKAKSSSLERLDKSLFRVASITMGAILFVLLGLQFGLQTYVKNDTARLDRKLQSIGPVYSEVRSLKRQVDALKIELSSGEAVRQRPSVARILHEIAASTPKGVWLYKLIYSYSDTTGTRVDIRGYSRTNEDAADYLSGLQTSRFFYGVRVVRVGAPTQLDLASFASAEQKHFVTFEVDLMIAP